MKPYKSSRNAQLTCSYTDFYFQLTNTDISEGSLAWKFLKVKFKGTKLYSVDHSGFACASHYPLVLKRNPEDPRLFELEIPCRD
jgi:hypothetical protein